MRAASKRCDCPLCPGQGAGTLCYNCPRLNDWRVDVIVAQPHVPNFKYGMKAGPAENQYGTGTLADEQGTMILAA